MNRKLGLAFVQEFVIGFGFFSGLWIYLGIDPEAKIATSLLWALTQLNAPLSGELTAIWWIISIVVPILSILFAFLIGKWAGLASVLFAFFGGLLFNSGGIWLLVAGIFLGFFSPYIAAHFNNQQ